MPDSPVRDAAATLPDIAPVGPRRAVAAGVPNSGVYFRKGFGLKAEVQEELASDYNGRLVDLLRGSRHREAIIGRPTNNGQGRTCLAILPPTAPICSGLRAL